MLNYVNYVNYLKHHICKNTVKNVKMCLKTIVIVLKNSVLNASN